MAKNDKSKLQFKLNEPVAKIANGDTRKSVRVSKEKFPARIYREKINGALLMHDADSKPGHEITANDIELLKQIASEGSMSNNIPALRYNAILKLSAFPSTNTLNTLSWFALYGEDEYIKSHALLALARTGMELTLPIVAGYLTGKNRIVAGAAQKSLIMLAKTIGMERVLTYFKMTDKANYRSVRKILNSLNDPKKLKRRFVKKHD
jgi:hypothetical protein